jgi:hypothetical protein
MKGMPKHPLAVECRDEVGLMARPAPHELGLQARADGAAIPPR